MPSYAPAGFQLHACPAGGDTHEAPGLATLASEKYEGRYANGDTQYGDSAAHNNADTREGVARPVGWRVGVGRGRGARNNQGEPSSHQDEK